MTDDDANCALLETHVHAMIRGEVPTTGSFHCPKCSGTARVYASLWRGETLAVAIVCSCCEIEMDGVNQWPEWQALSREPQVG